MKVSVITMHSVKNYGSALQTFATQKVLENMGLEVEFINYIRSKYMDKNLLETWTEKDKGLSKLIKKVIIYPTVQKWKKVFWNYLNENVTLTPHTYLTPEDFEKYPVHADIFCTGSDQVWNSGWNEGIEYPFFLTFAPQDKPRISFSASIGKSELTSEEISQIRPLLKQYKYITMREDSGLQLIKGMGITNCGFCLDPTLLLSKDEWLKHMKPIQRNKKYVLIYQLNRNKDFDRYAVEFAKRKNLQLVRFCTRYDQARLPGIPLMVPDIQEFPSLIANAEYVITDSFHATAFSINLNTEFISVYPQDYSSRINDILKLTGLEYRKLESFDDFETTDKKIDFDCVNNIILREREESLNEIKKMIEMCL